MLTAIFSFFASNSKIFGIATIALGVALLTLGIYSGIKIGALHVENATQKSGYEEAIKDLKNEHKEAIKMIEEKLVKLQKEKEDLQDTVSQVKALSAQERADAARNAQLGLKKQQEIKRTYEERMKRFEEKIKGVKDYGESDPSIVDAAGI